MKIVSGTTVRENSRRFPGKALSKILMREDGSEHYTSMDVAYKNISKCERIDESYILTSDTSPNIIERCETYKIPYISMPDENDVFSRFKKLIETTGADIVIRHTGDDIFTSEAYANTMLTLMEAWDYDYVYPLHHIKGCEVEVFKASKLLEVIDRCDKSQIAKSEYMSWFFKHNLGIKQFGCDFGHTKSYKAEFDTSQDYTCRVLPLISACGVSPTEVQIEEFFDKNSFLQGFTK